MKRDIKKIWIDALTSGKYHQGQGQLKKIKNKHCCLGVLCDLHLQMTGKGKWNFHDGEYEYIIIKNGYRNSAFLPDEVMKWAGIKNNSCRYNVNSIDTGNSLMYQNDTGAPFKEIAELVEKHF